MRSNTLVAILNIIDNPFQDIRTGYKSQNRANSMGLGLENYIRDIFGNTTGTSNENERLEKLSEVFSYQGNQNNPPDLILRNGDAIEVKKIQNFRSGIALNSSYPKATLKSSNRMITDACRNCEKEPWEEKDLLYAIGTVNNNIIKRLFFVYGIDYAANEGTYERIRHTISSGISSIPDVEFSKTNELGRVNRVDPLGITYLRIRGMWGIENPIKVFDYVYEPSDAEFEFTAIINQEKYYSFPVEDRLRLEEKTGDNFKIKDIKIKTPDNPSQLRNAKLISFLYR